ncbi:hypothetical protein [Solirubrobacter soli]|uniref:hypothetical protein n=1 Tax=Solirubrobacter soli TaxID=363832 RepID=UPI0003FB9EEE|nr:hypothetical protein [Solirubrobacter soli]
MNRHTFKFALALSTGALLATAGAAHAATEYTLEVVTPPAVNGSQNAPLNAINPFGAVVGSARFPGVPEVQPTIRKDYLRLSIGGDASGRKHKGEAFGINRLGNVVGYMQSTVSGLKRPYLWESTSRRELPIFPGLDVVPRDIDDNGNIVGAASSDTGASTAFLYSPSGNLVGLPAVTGGKVAKANDINDNGLVVGQSDGFATSWPRGVPTKLGALPGSTSNEALKSNIGDTAVGLATLADGGHRAVLFAGGTATDLHFPAAGTAADVRANSINDAGTVVGTGDVSTGATAVRYMGGQVVDLNTLIPSGSGLTLRTATDVNDDGQIAGSATPASDPNAVVGYVLTPVR